MLIILESEACLDAAAVLYLYPARHTQAAPVFINCFKDHSASREVQPVRIQLEFKFLKILVKPEAKNP